MIRAAGQRVVVVRCEELNISGSFYRNKCKLRFSVEECVICYIVESLDYFVILCYALADLID